MSFPPSSGWHAKIIIVRANTFCLIKNEGGASPHLALPLCLLPLPPILPPAFSVSPKEGKQVTIPFLLVFSIRKAGMERPDKSRDMSWIRVSTLPRTFSRCLVSFLSCSLPNISLLPSRSHLPSPSSCSGTSLTYYCPETKGGHQGKVPSTSCSPAFTLCIPVYWYLSTDLLVCLQILDICPRFRKRQRTKDIFYLCVQ